MLNIKAKSPQSLIERFKQLSRINPDNVDNIIDVVSKKGDFYDNVFTALQFSDKDVSSLLSKINQTNQPTFVIEFLENIKYSLDLELENPNVNDYLIGNGLSGNFLLSPVVNNPPYSAVYLAKDEDVAFHKDFISRIKNSRQLLIDVIEQQNLLMYGTSNEMLDFAKNAEFVDITSLEDELMAKVFVVSDARDDLVEFAAVKGADILKIQETLLRIPYDGDFTYLTQLAQVKGTNSRTIAMHVVENGSPNDVNDFIIANTHDLPFVSKLVHQQINNPEQLNSKVKDEWLETKDTDVLLSNIQHLIKVEIPNSHHNDFKYGVELLSTERQSRLIERYSNISPSDFKAVKQVVEANGDYFDHMFLMLLNPKEDINTLMKSVMSKVNIDFCCDTLNRLNNDIENLTNENEIILSSPFIKHGEFYNADEDSLTYQKVLNALHPHKEVLKYFSHQANEELNAFKYKLASTPDVLEGSLMVCNDSMLPIPKNDLALLQNAAQVENDKSLKSDVAHDVSL